MLELVSLILPCVSVTRQRYSRYFLHTNREQSLLARLKYLYLLTPQEWISGFLSRVPFPHTHRLINRFLSVCTQFLPHDAMRKRGLCCRPVSVSACLSSVRHGRVLYCIQTDKHIVKLLSLPSSSSLICCTTVFDILTFCVYSYLCPQLPV